MKTKILIIFGLLVILSLQSINADHASVEVIEASDEVEAGDEATFKIIVTNNQNERDVFKIYGDEFAVYPFSDFASLIKTEPSQVKLNPEESAEVTIKIRTLDTAKVNTKYITKIKVASLIKQEEKTTFELTTYLVSATDVIEISPQNLPEKIIPGKDIKVTTIFKNRARLPLDYIEIFTSSDVSAIAEPISLNFKEREEIIKNLFLNFNLQSTPGIHTVNIKAYQNDKIKGSFTKEVIILPLENIEEERDVEKKFLQSLTTITRINNGNVATNQRVETHYPLIKRIFTSLDPKPKKEKGNYVWEFILEPKEEKEIKVLINYRPLLYGLIIVLIFTGIMLFHVERSITLRKKIFKLREEKDGISEFKILLHLRNGKKYPLKDVKVMDVVPNVIHLTNEFGTLKPIKIQKGSHSNRMVWEIGNLDSKEERVLSYKVKSKLNLLGGIQLPASIVVFKSKKNNLIQIKSARLKVERKN